MRQHVLIVDDSPSSRKLIKLALRRNTEISILEAENGMTALAIVEQQAVDLIILDLMMSQKDGLTVLRELREHPEYRQIPVIVCSASRESQSIIDALEIGAYDYFSKPLSQKDIAIILPLKVNNALRMYQQQKAILQAHAHIDEQNELVTRLQQAEAALQHKNEELEQVLEHLRDTQMQMVQQGKLVGIGQLAGGVAHEINNPLGSINSNFQVLQRYVETLQTVLPVLNEAALPVEQGISRQKLDFLLEDMGEILQESQLSLGRITRIVRSLRTFTSVEREELAREYDLNEGIRHALLLLESRLQSTAVIETELSEVPLIRAVSQQLNQVLIDVLLNAIQAIEAKQCLPGRIAVKTYRDERYVYCLIRDDGVGIAANNLDKVFEPFFTTKPIGQATGLGLSIAYDIIVNKHNGHIAVDSAPMVGTTIVLQLPLLA